MTNPIDIIANAIRAADGNHTASAGLIAEVAVAALNNEQIIANAVRALLDEGWRFAHEGPQGQSELSDFDLASIARTVLRSVGGA